VSNIFLVQCKQLLPEAGNFIASQLTRQPNFETSFSAAFSSVVLLSHLQRVTNIGASSMTFLYLDQQSTNGENSEQITDYQTQALDNH